ncbi:hypothetical protein IQ268_28210 [Oculatella sp. LEGE 06141]|uniref:ribonuclease III family protein n=1 Tax=Oculatella sp. LEGE 06141 TaxID=1828648 RepID=UPI00188309BA|nr:ribonuclease III domain-containing protein [Oculatella sp. LEGE 06141]MBE9182437.1 hypothetical protein [Oculatella sp. LEGE 06141]
MNSNDFKKSKITSTQQILKLLTGSFFQLESSQLNDLTLYNQALTHSTYANEKRDQGIPCEDQERLEFLGDRVLNLSVAEFLFQTLPDPEGILSEKIKAVQNEHLAQIVKQKSPEIIPLIKLGNGQSLEDSILADTLEALIGAIYLDPNQGLSQIQTMIQTSLANDILSFNLEQNYISQLQEHIQKYVRKGNLEATDIDYVQIKHTTDAQNRHTFVYVVKILDKSWGQGTGHNVKTAKQAAAAAALSKIEAGNTPFE